MLGSLPLRLVLILPHGSDEGALRPDGRPVSVKDKRDRDDDDLDDCEKSARPVWAKAPVHGRPGEREGATEKRADQRIAGHGGRGVYTVGVDQVVGGIDEDGRVSGAKGYAGGNWDGPMDRGRGTRPSKP